MAHAVLAPGEAHVDPTPTPVGNDSCRIQGRWLLAAALADSLIALDRWAAAQFSAQGLRWPGLTIISGHRPPSVQTRVNPFAPASKHTRCPSMAADLRVGSEPASVTDATVWRWLGVKWKTIGQGGRWGGSFRVEDLNHFESL